MWQLWFKIKSAKLKMAVIRRARRRTQHAKRYLSAIYQTEVYIQGKFHGFKMCIQEKKLSIRTKGAFKIKLKYTMINTCVLCFRDRGEHMFSIF